MWWSLDDLNDWLQLAVETPKRSVRHGLDRRFRSRVLSEGGGASTNEVSTEVFAVAPGLLQEALRDIVHRIGPCAPGSVAVVVREFPFEHAPDIGVFLDPRLPPQEFLRLYNRACGAVATSLSLLKMRLDKKQAGGEAGEKQGGKRSGVILQGRAGPRFVEVPFLPHAPTVQLTVSGLYITHHRPYFLRGNGEVASFDLFRLRGAGQGRGDKHGVDMVIYHSNDQELARLFSRLPFDTAPGPARGVLRWSEEHLRQEAELALAHPENLKGYMGHKWERMAAQ